MSGQKDPELGQTTGFAPLKENQGYGGPGGPPQYYQQAPPPGQYQQAPPPGQYQQGGISPGQYGMAPQGQYAPGPPGQYMDASGQYVVPGQYVVGPQQDQGNELMLGIILGFCFGLLGLFGLFCIDQNNPAAKSRFTKGWGIGCGVFFVIYLVIIIVVVT